MPDGFEIRPTGARAKEAVFSILGTRVGEAKLLDLFAGSGALGLEALSRGAALVVAVDNGREATRIIAENVGALGFGERYELMPFDCSIALDRLSSRTEAFDLIFLDPPYGYEGTVGLIEKCVPLIAVNGMIVLESEEPPQKAPKGFSVSDTRMYGRERFTFMKPEKSH